MINRAEVSQVVLACLSEILTRSEVTPTEPLGTSAPLIGGASLLDSLGLVELIVDVEQRLEAERGLTVTLADDRAMSLRQSPFRTVDTLVDYICLLADEHNGHAQA